uniref:Uncharacterized protein n=1 Tax=Anopheles dirus TaxID=7168 RepID=A0A182NI26_9DIPT
MLLLLLLLLGFVFVVTVVWTHESLDDLEVEFVNALQSTQQEMMSKLAMIDADVGNGVTSGSGTQLSCGVGTGGPGAGGNNAMATGPAFAVNAGQDNAGDPDPNSPRTEPKKKESRKWKNWGWKTNNAPNVATNVNGTGAGGPKQASIEEEADSPKRSAGSTRHSSPAESPKHKLLLGTGKVEDVNSSSSISPASLRRKKFLSSKNQSPVNRSEARASAGARLYEELESSLQDSDSDELAALIVNGRPATIHLIQPSTIPGLINEEGESGLQSADGSTKGGGVSSTPGKPKDSKTHKVLGGFKKLKPEKDKDKDKDKDRDKDKEGGGGVTPVVLVSTGSGGGVTLPVNAASAVGGSSLVEEAKALMSSAKKINSKEKLSASGVGGGQPATVVVLSNGSILMGSGPPCSTTTTATTVAPTTNGDGTDGSVVTLAAGATANGGIGKQSLDIGESFDSGSELLQQHGPTTINGGASSNGGNTIKTTVLDMKNHGSIQVSQV